MLLLPFLLESSNVDSNVCIHLRKFTCRKSNFDDIEVVCFAHLSSNKQVFLASVSLAFTVLNKPSVPDPGCLYHTPSNNWFCS